MGNAAPPRYSQACRDRGVHGYYVVNRVTNIAAAGPFADHHAARVEAGRRNRIPLATPNLLEVRLIGPSKVPDL